jgi:hypothetical protein
MKIKIISFWCMVSICILAIASCAARTSFTSVWKDDQYQGRKLDKILVIGVSKRPEIRKMFEAEFVNKIRALGADGVASHTVVTGDKEMDRSTILANIQTLNADSVLITKLIDREDAIKNVAPQHLDLHSQYARSYNYVHNRGYLLQDQAVSLETNLYDARNSRLIWSALTETFIRGDDEEVIKSFINKITDNLQRQKLL